MAKYVPPHRRNRDPAVGDGAGLSNLGGVERRCARWADQTDEDHDGGRIGRREAWTPSGWNSRLPPFRNGQDPGSQDRLASRKGIDGWPGGYADGDWFHRRDGRRPNGWGQPSEYAIFGEKQSPAGINFDDYDKIPVQTSGTNAENLGKIDCFAEARLSPNLAANLERCGYVRPTPVQKHAIPIVCEGRDVMACAQTGSGKTCAFMVPAIEVLLRSGPPDISTGSDRLRRTPQPCVLVMSPTRELTSQIFAEGRKFAYNTGIRVCVVYGGADMRDQRRELNSGCDVLIATPGRLTDMFERGMVTLSFIQFFILDEADRMLDMGFEPQVRKIVEGTDMGQNLTQPRQSMMFSATFPKEVQMMARDFLNDYIFITIGRVGSASELIQQTVVYATEHDKVRLLMRTVDEETPRGGLTLVFVETKRGADMLEQDLWNSKLGVGVSTIHGDRSQHEREEALMSFRSGRTSIMIATDVAARGLDIPNVNLVVNYDMPKAVDDYVHRIGRTGRAGRRGKAYAFVNDRCGGQLLSDLLDILEENEETIPPWFEDLCKRNSCRYGSTRKKGAGKGKHRFGGRDHRVEFPRGGGDGWRGGGGGGGGGSDWRR